MSVAGAAQLSVKPTMKTNNKEIIKLASVVLTCLTLSLSVSAETKANLLPKTPRGIADLFCRLDFGGARLGMLS